MKILFNILCVYVFLLPFQFALNVASGFDVAIIRIAVLILFGLIIIRSLYKKDFFIPLNLQSVCLSGFFLINIFSLFFAQNLEFGLRKILFLASIFPLYFIVYYLIRPSDCHCEERSNLQTLAPFFIFGGFLSSSIALIIFLNQFIFGIDNILYFYSKVGPFFWGETFSRSVLNYQSFLVNIGGIDFIRAAGLFPDPHNFALFAGIILFLSLPFVKSYFYGFTFLFSGVALLLSFSRGAYLALIITALIICSIRVYLLIKSNRLNLNKILIPTCASMAILIFIFLLSPVKDRFLDTFSLEDGSNVGRIQIMKDGFDIFKNNFFIGVGIGNAPIYFNEDADYRNPTNSHNTYMEIAIENGFSGLAIWLILIFGTILQLIKYLKFQEDDFYRHLAIGLIGALIFFSAHSFFEVFLYSPVNLFALMILLALSSATIRQSPKT